MSKNTLKRELGLFSSILIGLGSILGTGVFVMIGAAAGIVNEAVIIAILLASIVALLNGLSSAELAINNPVSGGTYEYGRIYLNPLIGFTTGWMFIIAKCSSAATAALGFSGYLLYVLGKSTGFLTISISIVLIVALTILILHGLKKTKIVNNSIVLVTLISLILFIFLGVFTILDLDLVTKNVVAPIFSGDVSTYSILQATGLIFVAFTGYGRIATLGEEVKEPGSTIPKAVILTLLITLIIYLFVGYVGITILGGKLFSTISLSNQAPLTYISKFFISQKFSLIFSLGALTAMLGVLINLILGISRVILAMGRNGDLPRTFSKIDKDTSNPIVAVIITGLLIIGFTLIGDVKTTWTISAFSVLFYYSITNLSAMRIPRNEKKYPYIINFLGFVLCIALFFTVEPSIYFLGMIILALGLFVYLSRKLILRS